jgi:two-component system sensor histidine kinase SenX3
MTAAIKLDQTRRDFVANISHELKTPIGSISLLVEAIQAAIDEPQQLKKFVQNLGTEAERLALLVQDIIQLSRVQSPAALAETQDLSLAVLLAEAIDQTSTIAKRQGVQVKVSGKTQVTVPGNSEMLTALFKNLLENAINYSKEESKVNIKVKPKGHLIQVAFSDNGIGIPPEDQERIFERFYRVDPSRSRSTGGTGLGLSIAKHIVNQHGGEISVKSKLGKGSTFLVSLPTKEASKE